MPRVKKAEATTKTVKAAPKKAAGLSVPIYSLDGKQAGNLELPKELFGAKVNDNLLAQAVRVYVTNQSRHYSNTKTRSEVQGSTRKIYKQKGTGGARHGQIRAPIFVGGGIALGPKAHKIVLEMPKRMRRAALVSALSYKFSQGEVVGADLSKASGKTAQLAKFLKSLSKKNVLFVLGANSDLVKRAASNLSDSNVETANNLNAYEVLKYQTLVVDKNFVNVAKEVKDAGSN